MVLETDCVDTCAVHVFDPCIMFIRVFHGVYACCLAA